MPVSALAQANSASSSGISDSYPAFRRAHQAATQPLWQMHVLAKVTALLQLEPGWDGYRAPVPQRDAAMFALEILQGVMTATTPEPSVVPSSVGGVQLEWHDSGIDLEIHVAAPYSGEIWWFDHTANREHTAPLGQDLSTLHEPIARLSK
jgi:hypothetical protein